MPYPYYQYQNYNPMFYQHPQQYVQQNPQIQNGGLVIVKDIQEAMNYAVAPGHSVTFKVESQPYICTKTLGFSQLDQPIFEVFRLVKEEQDVKSEEIIEEVPVIEYMTLEDANEMRVEMQTLRSEIDFLREALDSYTKEVKDEND